MQRSCLLAATLTTVFNGLAAADREPVTKRTLVFSRSQMKYGLDRNYLRRWVDRPLFIDPALRDYLGITWAENPQSTINNCIATFSGLSDIPLIGNQTSNAVFETGLSNNERTLLFQEKEVIPLDLTVEQGIEFFVSGGIASPDKFPLRDKLNI